MRQAKAVGVISLFNKHGRELLMDVVVGFVWGLYASLYLIRLLSTGKVIDLGVLLFFTLLAFMFLTRSPAQRLGAPWETLLALVGTFLPPVVARSAPGGLPWLGEGIQFVSITVMVAALICLGGSFAIAPADRGLRTTGLYRWVRHPLYAGEISFYIGYLMANPSPRNLIGLVAIIAIQIARITREEKILVGYANYASRVRWRLVPFVW